MKTPIILSYLRKLHIYRNSIKPSHKNFNLFSFEDIIYNYLILKLNPKKRKKAYEIIKKYKNEILKQTIKLFYPDSKKLNKIETICKKALKKGYIYRYTPKIVISFILTKAKDILNEKSLL